MRKLLVPLLAVVALIAAGAAAGKTSTTVTISKTGYTPTAVSITVGDEVIFKNTDTVAHTVNFNATTGVSCSATPPLAIPAGQSANCTFSSAGRFRFSDPASNKKAFRGTITVSPSLVSSLKATPKTVVYGAKSTLDGKLASGQSGQAVQIRQQMCGETKSTAVATVTSTAAGAFTLPGAAREEDDVHAEQQGRHGQYRRRGRAEAAAQQGRAAPLQREGLRGRELRGQGRDLPALPRHAQALGEGQARHLERRARPGPLRP